MADIKNPPLKSGISELEKIFQEYKGKLEHAEQEAQEIIDSARQKAEAITADKQKEAQQIVFQAKQKATLEADRIVSEAKNRAVAIEKELDDKVRKDAKERTKREIERIIANAKQTSEKQSAEITDRAKREAEETVKEVRKSAQVHVLEESEYIIIEAKEKAKKLDEDSITRAEEAKKLIVDVSQKAEGILDRFRTQLHAELNELSVTLGKAVDNLEVRSILDKNEIIARDNEKTSDKAPFNGRRELNILPPYSSIQIRKLVEFLKQIPGIKLDGEAATEDDFSIYINIVESIPLHNILGELSLVESSDVRGDIIKLKLKASKNGS
ncbi:hypothetical protein ACFLXF_03950 [Chloroflexota bacterium]